MSSIYITEPATKGKVILKTTMGDIDVELWPKEAPKATRNFVQLCMEGYYDNTVFHRIIKNFIMQGGDPTGTGFAGESIYGGSFPDEFHSRLRFSHRGIVAMAGTHSTDQNNGSQFFITFDKAPDLQGKHTIFGKVTGDTIFNLLKANDFEVDENDKPLFPPKIISVDVVNNPFDDIIPRVTKKSDNSKQQKGKPTKNLNLLSFGEEAEAEEEEINSSSSNITMKSTYAFSENAEERESARQAELKKQQDRAAKGTGSTSNESAAAKLKQSIAEGPKADDDFASRMREKVRQSKKKFFEETDKNEGLQEEESTEPKDRMIELAEQQNLLKKEILEMKKKKEKGDKEEKTVKMTLLDEQRAKYVEKYQVKKRKRGQPVNEALILGKLEGFKKSLKGNESSKEENKKGEEEESKEEKFWDPLEILKDVDNLDEGNDPGWLNHSLKFEKLTKSKDPMLRNEDDSYTTFDPLKQKDKGSDHVSHHKKRLSSQKKLDKW